MSADRNRGPAPERLEGIGGTHDGPLLIIEGLSLRFGGITALDDVSFTVGAGERLAVIGPNGAGKTSILNCLSGLYRPDRGSMRLNGTEVVGLQPVAAARLGIARTFQNLGLFPTLDVMDNLLLGRHRAMTTGLLAGALWVGRARREEVAQRRWCEGIVKLLALRPYRHARVGTLPYGLQKRVELGRALAMDPALLLLDEPVAGMNVEETDDLARIIVRITAELGLAMILVEHDMHLVMEMAERVLVLDFGRVIAAGTPAAIQSDRKVIEVYLGRGQGEPG